MIGHNPKPSYLSAEWRDLVVINYESDSSLLKQFTPRGTELDLWHGRTLISLVAFKFMSTRVFGFSFPFHTNFIEINLRFYVKREVSGEIRRGVVFIKELVPRHAIALIARLFYNENYYAVPMSHSIKTDADRRALVYKWRERQNEWTIAANVSGDAQELIRNSEAEFVLEHYWGYSKARSGKTIEYQVSHPRWRTWDISNLSVSIDFDAVYGPNFGEALKKKPVSSFVAEGSEITVHKGTCLQ